MECRLVGLRVSEVLSPVTIGDFECMDDSIPPITHGCVSQTARTPNEKYRLRRPVLGRLLGVRSVIYMGRPLPLAFGIRSRTLTATTARVSILATISFSGDVLKPLLLTISHVHYNDVDFWTGDISPFVHLYELFCRFQPFQGCYQLLEIAGHGLSWNLALYHFFRCTDPRLDNI
jgi:hypothetical protein